MVRSYLVAMTVAGLFQGTAASAEPFYDAALCKPPYTMDSATTLYEAVEKIAKPDKSLLTAEVYKLPDEIGQDGFSSREVVFAGTAIGVLVQGLQADALAKRYHLEPERSSLLGTSSKGYARALPAAEQPSPDAGIVSIVARESPSLPGKTLLACELVMKEDQAALDSYEKAKDQ
ncbi:hypothetical protein G4G27_10425 [Sphingomonas sp. So64.6b]|uniref:hypothetical protein n=1 Tax=Sphingomonas sp. So64.6b TaxID=2997354 RepID=UPI0015FF75D6|nr:hypothetical protein [Sphingomonas sp. So64.6b]QNA84354.1 hypothetical protein G4G27_10425 [Sphingomonas sp. So64.6b]